MVRCYSAIVIYQRLCSETVRCCSAVVIDQGLYSEMVYITHDYTSHINSYPVQVDDIYCSAVQCIDQGLHTELVCNYV